MRIFKSLLFTDDNDGKKDDPKLVACLDRDSAHIGPGANGSHVTKIQIALETLDAANLTLEKGTYGTETIKAVKQYKDSPKRLLLQPGQTKADEFVGKRTIRSLDDEMFRVENRGPGRLIPIDVKRLSGSTLARLDVPLALQKIDVALRKLREFETTLSLRLGPRVRFEPFDKVTENALRTHFRLVAFDSVAPPGAGTGRGFPRRPVTTEDIKHLLLHFQKIRSLFLSSLSSFKDGSPVGRDGKPVAAAAFLNSNQVIFGSHFRNFTAPDAEKIGPNSRAAILIHEGFHAVDAALKSGNDVSVHISEFSASYDTQPADDSLFNPSSYASFAAHVFKGRDPSPRFGLGPGARAL